MLAFLKSYLKRHWGYGVLLLAALGVTFLLRKEISSLAAENGAALRPLPLPAVSEKDLEARAEPKRESTEMEFPPLESDGDTSPEQADVDFRADSAEETKERIDGEISAPLPKTEADHEKEPSVIFRPAPVPEVTVRMPERTLPAPSPAPAARPEKADVMRVECMVENGEEISVLGGDVSSGSFHGLDDGQDREGGELIRAVVDRGGSFGNGDAVLLRLLVPVRVGDGHVERGKILTGTCTLTESLLRIEVRSMRQGLRLYPVSLCAVAEDGTEGIRLRTRENLRDLREGASDAAGSAVGSVSVPSSLPSAVLAASRSAVSSLSRAFRNTSRSRRIELEEGMTVYLKNSER